MALVAPRGTFARDVQVAVAAFAGGLLLLSFGTFFRFTVGRTDVPNGLFLVPLAVVCTGLALRRQAPLAGLGLGLLALVGDIALGGSLATILIFTQVLYEVCVHGPPWLWRWALRVSIGLTVAATVIAIIITRDWRGGAFGVPFALVFGLSVVSAISVRQYRDQASTERARAEQTARLAELDRGQAVTAERHRMARELHDVIANHLNAVAIHASALLSVKDLDRTAVRRALRVIRENSVQGLAEMRQMVELLRDPRVTAEPEDVTTARLAEADRLVGQARDAGLSVALTVAGVPRPLPVNVDLAGYRILQESLTNALKHGAGGAEVVIAYEPEHLTLTVTNPAGDTASGVPGSGSGLIGMRERVELVGGSFDAGRNGSGWQVRARLLTAEQA